VESSLSLDSIAQVEKGGIVEYTGKLICEIGKGVTIAKIIMIDHSPSTKGRSYDRTSDPVQFNISGSTDFNGSSSSLLVEAITLMSFVLIYLWNGKH